MIEVLPGVYQMTLTLSGFNPGSINVYLLRAKDGYLIVDTGWDTPAAAESMDQQLGEAGIRFTEIKRVVVTHCHVDHLGMIGRFKRSHNAEIYLHENEIELINIRFKNGDNFVPLTDQFVQIHGVPLAELTPPEFEIPKLTSIIAPDVLLKGGEEIPAGEYTLRVINTPGHTPGHISLYEPKQRFLISGDVLLPTIATNAAFHVQHTDNPLQKYLNSLAVLRELEVDLVLPGHEHVFGNHRKRIDELFRHNRLKDEGIMKAFGDGQAHNAYEVSRLLAWSLKTRTTNWTNLSGWDKRFAVLQTIAHLEEMAGEEKLDRMYREGQIFYRPPGLTD